MRYVKAENYLCFLALIEMIIEKETGYSEISQYNLAEEFGITVPRDATINVKNVRYSDCDSEYGVFINERLLNEFFRKRSIKLEAVYYKVNPYVDLDIDEYGKSILREGKYIIYTYSYGYLFHESDKYDIGHVALLEQVTGENELLIYDPGPRNAGMKKVNRNEMYDAMRRRNGGIYVISHNPV